MAELEITVDGRWLSLNCRYGDIEMSTVWPGGSDELSWSLGTQPASRPRGGVKVAGYLGGACVWAGNLLEPDPSQDRMTAQGAWRMGEKFPALTSGGAAGTGPDQCIDVAIGRGLQWTRPASIFGSAVAVDVSQGPVTIGGLLDTYAENVGVRWGVNPRREVYATADPTFPTYQTWPLDGGLGYALDNYASTLICRYLDSGTSAYTTLPPVTDAAAEALHGHQEVVVDLTGRGPITSTVATSIANKLLTLGRSTPQWTDNIVASYGEILSMGGGAVALETVAAGTVVRVHGGFDLAQRQNGAMFTDVLIGQTNLAGGTLTLQPLLKASRSFTDVLTDALNKKK